MILSLFESGEDGMSVSDWSGSLLAWEEELAALKARLGPVFGRRELRDTGAAFLDGLLSGVERKTGWLMAEQSGAERPYRMQSLLGRSRWEADRLRDEVRAYALEALSESDAVLVVDETGFVKKGDHSWGWRVNILERPGASRTARSACSWPTPAAMARR
jgi:SRSO17 transposase